MDCARKDRGKSEMEIMEKKVGKMGISQAGWAGLKVLNRDVIKYIAMVTMLLNHVAHAFLPEESVLYEVFLDIGFFTAITMCYFLVEGYEYTHSKKRYALRLFFFALISQFPFWYVFPGFGLNMIFTLFVCFLILVAMEKIQHPTLRAVTITLLVFVTIISDWQLLAAIFTIMFVHAKGSEEKMVKLYGKAYLLFVFFNIISSLSMNGYSLWEALFHGLLSGIAILVSGVVILIFYNGKRAEYGRTFSKWFFYLFYPGHLLVIGLLARTLA
ncbi:MAG: conjugal transfer protein TraX [Blautia sp.]|nr:conjugal transfer protein TraX [Lachnoclostridium sp.]MCM1210947.1 conjugal transfer protein TraX [Blautia sp.]